MRSSVSLFCTLFPHAFWMTHVCSSSPFAHTHSFHTQGVKRGDGGGRETQKEKTGEEAAQQGTVLVCGNHHTHVGKTRQDMGMGGHTRGRKTWDTQGEREGRRQGVALPKTLTTQKKRKGKKTMSILRQSRALHRVHLFQPFIGTCHAWNDKKREG